MTSWRPSEAVYVSMVYVGASLVDAQKNPKIFAPQNKTVNIVRRQEVFGDL